MAAKRSSTGQLSLPGAASLEGGGKILELRDRKIPHRLILEMFRSGSDGGRSIAEIYRSEVLPIRTRIIHLLGKKSPAKIIHTLLGFEVQAGYKRIHCPDLATARYLRIFTEIGCRRIRLPYDPTVTEKLLPELESALARLSAGVAELFSGKRSLHLYVMRRVFHHIRVQLRSD